MLCRCSEGASDRTRWLQAVSVCTCGIQTRPALNRIHLVMYNRCPNGLNSGGCGCAGRHAERITLSDVCAHVKLAAVQAHGLCRMRRGLLRGTHSRFFHACLIVPSSRMWSALPAPMPVSQRARMYGNSNVHTSSTLLSRHGSWHVVCDCTQAHESQLAFFAGCNGMCAHVSPRELSASASIPQAAGHQGTLQALSSH